MDLNVELPNGVKKMVPVPVSCNMQKAVELTGLRTGLCRKAVEMEEFSLAWKDDNSDTFINVSWLNPQMPLVSQGVGSSRTLILRKKYFVKNKDLEDCLNSNKSSLMLETIYAQLRQSFVAGLYACSAFQAAQIAGMAALVEYSSSMVKNPLALRKIGLIKKIMPEMFWSIKGIENQITKGIENAKMNELEAMKAFITRLRKLETFGASFFTINLSTAEKAEGSTGLLCIGPQFVYTMEVDTLEPIRQWYTEDIVSFATEGDRVHLMFGDEQVTFDAEDGDSIVSFLGGYKKQLNNEEAKVVIQRSRSRRESRSDPDPPTSPTPTNERITQQVVSIERSPLHRPPQEKEKSDLERTVRKISPEKKAITVIRQSPVSKRKIVEVKKIAPVNTESSSTDDSPPVPPRSSSLVPRSPPSDHTPRTSPPRPSRRSSAEVAQHSPKVAQQVPGVRPSRPDVERHQEAFDGAVIAPETVASVGTTSELEKVEQSECVVKEQQQQFQQSVIPAELCNSPVLRVKQLCDDLMSSSSEENLHVVEEEDEYKRFPSVPGSPTSLSSRDSFKNGDERRAENEKKFDTLTRQSTNKALQGRKKRLNALKKKKTDGVLTVGEIAELKAVNDVKRRSSKKAKEVAKYISMPPQSHSECSSLDDISDLFELDLTRQRWSQDINPIYDFTAASEAESLLTSSNVTYEDPSKMFSRGQSEPPGVILDSDAVPNGTTTSTSSSLSKKKSLDFPPLSVAPMQDVNEAQAQVDSIYGRAFSPPSRPASTISTSSKDSTANGDLDTGVYGLVGIKSTQTVEDEIYQVPTGQLDDNVEEDIYRCMDSMEKRLTTDSDREKSPSPTILVHPRQSSRMSQPSPGIGKRRLINKGKSNPSIKTDKVSAALFSKAPVEPLKDFGTLKREFRVFYIKLPTGDVVHELINLNESMHKVILRLCALIGSKEPLHYSLSMEGSILTSMKEPQALIEGIESSNTKGKPPLDPLGFRSAAFSYLLPDQGDQPIPLNRERSMRDHHIHTSRLLALRFTAEKVSPESLPHQPLRVPPHIRFHQCWLSVVQGVQPCSQDDAIKLAALQYQTYFLDRSEHLSTTAHCTAAEFVPVEYCSVRNVEDKVMREQQLLKGYSRRQAQDSYIHDLCTLPTYKAVFFPVKEPRKRFFQNTKLMPMLLGVCKTGVMRVDPKTKEILDFWEYRIVKNWAYTMNTFLLAFDKQNYPVQTNQGKWINGLVEFFVSAIARKERTPTPDRFGDGLPFMGSGGGEKRKSLSFKLPGQDEVNAIYGQIVENGHDADDDDEAPLITPV